MTIPSPTPHSITFHYRAFVSVTNGVLFVREEKWLTSDPRMMPENYAIEIAVNDPEKPTWNGEYRVDAAGFFEYDANDTDMLCNCVVTTCNWHEADPQVVQVFTNPQPIRPTFLKVSYSYHNKKPESSQ